MHIVTCFRCYRHYIVPAAAAAEFEEASHETYLVLRRAERVASMLQPEATLFRENGVLLRLEFDVTVASRAAP